MKKEKYKLKTGNKRWSQMKNKTVIKDDQNEKYKRLIKGYHKWKIQTISIVKYKLIKGDHKWKIQTANKRLSQMKKYKRLIKGDHKWKIQTANKRLSQMKNTNG